MDLESDKMIIWYIKLHPDKRSGNQPWSSLRNGFFDFDKHEYRMMSPPRSRTSAACVMVPIAAAVKVSSFAMEALHPNDPSIHVSSLELTH